VLISVPERLIFRPTPLWCASHKKHASCVAEFPDSRQKSSGIHFKHQNPVKISGMKPACEANSSIFFHFRNTLPRKGRFMKPVILTSKLRMQAFGTTMIVMALSFPFNALADDGPEPETSLTFNVGATSDYRVRGIAQTSAKPAIQGGVDFAMKSGIYLGLAASNVTWVKEFNGATKGSYELDLYGGYKALIADSGFSYDVGLINYRYPGNNSGVAGFFPAGTYDNANTVEVYGALTYGIYTFKYNRSLGNFLGNVNSSGSQYFDLSAAVDMTNGYFLTPHVGRQLVPNQPGKANYSDIALTLSKDFGNGFTATAAALATNADRTFYTDTKNRYLANSTVALGLKYSF
jgi:uncharacterized protein (TIGR02001 family)